MQPNQSDRSNNIRKIKKAFGSMNKPSKALLKYGSYAFLMLFIIGAVLVILNHTILPYNYYFDLASKELVKTSFVIAAEVVIGSLAMDFVFKK